MSFRFGLRPPKAVSTLRDFNARGRQSRPCAKVFTCGENVCTAHSRRRPEGRVGAVLSACREFENIQIVVTSQKSPKTSVFGDFLLQKVALRVGQKFLTHTVTHTRK